MYSPFSGLPSLAKQGESDMENKWVLPKIYTGRNFVKEEWHKIMSLSGMDGSYGRLMYFEPEIKRNRLRFYTLMACLEKIDIELPPEMRLYLWLYVKNLPQQKKPYCEINLSWDSFEK